jgi:N-acetylneuraminic acid mutarotase
MEYSMNYSSISAIVAALCLILSFTLAYAATGINDSHTNSPYWSIGQNMSERRNEVTGVVLNGNIYAIGGEDKASGGGQKNTVEVYDIAKGKWVNDTAPMPLPLDHTASAVYDGKIYVVGGFLKHKVPTDKLFIYDPQKNQWQEGKSLPSSIGAALNAQFINGILYVVGGLNSSDVPVNTNYAYNPKTNTWSTKAPMPTARQHLQTAVVDGKLFALGGRILGDGVQSEDLDEASSNFNRNEKYDPQTDSWTIREPMLTKRSGFAAAASSDGNIYVFGGEGVGKVLNSVEKYNPKLDKWTYEKPMPTGRFGIKAVNFGDKIFVIGGQLFGNSSLVPLNINEIFHIGKDKKD